MIAGVCAGIAEYLGWEIGSTRIAWLLLTIFTVGFPGITAYIVLWLLMPKDLRIR